VPGIKQVNCPTCQKIVPWSEAELYRPFCSKKCQLIDFGDWASERHSIPVTKPLSAFEELDEDQLDE
jgi:endogenous inhibitor of DNA gyrase (YacG/DUF329 family)